MYLLCVYSKPQNKSIRNTIIIIIMIINNNIIMRMRDVAITQYIIVFIVIARWCHCTCVRS